MDQQKDVEHYFAPKYDRFKSTTKEDRDNILLESKPKNTRKSTDLWMNCFQKYLVKKSLPTADRIKNEDLPDVLESFYCEVEKTTIKTSKKLGENEEKGYKNTTMRTIQAAIARYYRDQRGIDIITNENFLRSNQIFKGVQKMNKKKGLGKLDSKAALTELDMERLMNYFLTHMNGPPNPRKLQELMIFNIIFYLCRRGRENLRVMKKTTFMVGFDEACGRKYVFQAQDELDKNHQEKENEIANQGRIYELPGETRSMTKHEVNQIYLYALFVQTTQNIPFFQSLTYAQCVYLSCTLQN